MVMLNSERVVFENCSLFSCTRLQDDSGVYSPVNWRLRLGLERFQPIPAVQSVSRAGERETRTIDSADWL